MIEVKKVNAITEKKIYKSIKAGALKTRRVDEFLESIVLQLECANQKDPVVLPFYERNLSEIQDLRGLEKKARNWQLILSKITTTHKNGLEETRQLHLTE